MAENEILDFWKNNSPRRKALLALFKSSGPTVKSVSCSLEDDLFSYVKRLSKGGVIKSVLAAASNGEDLRKIVHTFNGNEFAQVFELEAVQTTDLLDALENSLWFFVERVLDQVGQEVVPSESWPDFPAFHRFGTEIQASIGPTIHSLAEKLYECPDRPPRRPPRSRATREEWQQELQQLSLLPVGRRAS